MMSNLALWNAVEKTPVEHTKAITGKSYSGTSPKPHWLVRKATETFGPCGIGWGFDIVDERIETGVGEERMSIARVRVWYVYDGKRGEVEHIGGTPFCGIRKSGASFIDEDAPKKSVTDALVKALSMIGFAGDIFMGRYDDSKYVSELHAEAKEASKPKPAPVVVISDELPPLDGAEESQIMQIQLILEALAKHKTYNSLATWWKQNQPTIKAALPSDYYEAEVCNKQIIPRLNKYKGQA